MPLPSNFHSTVEEVLGAYPRTLVTVTCDQMNGELLGGHWAIYPPSPADYFVKCLCGCTEVYTVYSFEKHAGRGARKKWRESLRVTAGAKQQSLGTWIEDRCNAADAGLPEEGSRVIIYWPGAEGSKWHHGQVKDIDDNGRSTVAYDDGDREVLYLAMERFKLEESTPPPAPRIKHEDPASPAQSVVDLCFSSGDLDDIQGPPLFLEDIPEQAAAVLKHAAPTRLQATEPQQSAAQHRVNATAAPQTASAAAAAAAAARTSPGLVDALPAEPSRRKSQAPHARDAPARQHPPAQTNHTTLGTPMLSRAPVHGPRLPDRTQKRKGVDRRAEPQFRLPRGANAPQELAPGNHNSKATAAMSPSAAHMHLTNKSGVQQLRLPSSHNEHKANEPAQRNIRRSPKCATFSAPAGVCTMCSGTAAKFLANLDKCQGHEARVKLDRYYCSICKLVQRRPGMKEVKDILCIYFESLFS